jgi:hypothetical protein
MAGRALAVLALSFAASAACLQLSKLDDFNVQGGAGAPTSSASTGGAGSTSSSSSGTGGKVDGQHCAAGGECDSTFCVDGVCCHTACTDACHACSASLTGGTDGTCSTVADGSADPRQKCASTAASSCGTDGHCSAGACRFWAMGTTCAGPSCAAGSQTTEANCDGAGNCKPGTTTWCGAYGCNATACYTSCTTNAQCAANAACAGSTCLAGVLAAGQNHTCAVVNGGAQCWGWGGSGCLGAGDFNSSPTPVKVIGLSTGVQAVAARASHTCAVVNGGAQCWGGNMNGELGDGTNTASPTPVQVKGLPSGVVQEIVIGAGFACALVNGGVQCWGDNTFGQLGNGTKGGKNGVPAPVMGLTSGVQAIAAGWSHACAIVKSGGVQCWGDGSDHGELGNGVKADSPVPVQVTGLTSGVHAISLGDMFSCALLDTGDVQCWGQQGVEGFLGNNNTVMDFYAPVQVVGLTMGVQAIYAGDYHTCAIMSGVQCWGTGGAGELGNGGTAPSPVPVQVMGLTSAQVW